jgi:hypothetical protein
MTTQVPGAKAPVKHLFLDLEDTVITAIETGWADTELMNIEKVKTFMAEFQPDFVHIFSFAIWHEEDLASFEWSIRQRLEKALGVAIHSVPMLDTDILKACCNSKWIAHEVVTRREVIDFWGKQDGFRLFVRNKLAKHASTHIVTDVVLLDDMVEHEEFAFPAQGLRGRILNISEI